MCPSRRSSLAVIARGLRATPTSTEARLWLELRGSRLGVAFRRQVPVAGFIVDFCAPAVKLIVEVDGGYHAGRGRQDARRDRALVAAGYRVLRVPAEVVAKDVAVAVGWICAGLTVGE